MSEKVSKCLTPLTSTITNRKRDSHFNTEFKFLDSKIKRFKKEEKNNSPKNFVSYFFIQSYLLYFNDINFL